MARKAAKKRMFLVLFLCCLGSQGGKCGGTVGFETSVR